MVEMFLTMRLPSFHRWIINHHHWARLHHTSKPGSQGGGPSPDDLKCHFNPPCDVIPYLACTGTFPKFKHCNPLLVPGALMSFGISRFSQHHSNPSQAKENEHGVMDILVTSLPEQHILRRSESQVSETGRTLVVSNASPSPVGEPTVYREPRHYNVVCASCSANGV
ncbi:cyclohexanone monooxygenase [Moniliophthora roreri]|nr:cyclohexanone monooxygenase [Moniliophthora roreri]